jgi:hypothetical protein
MLPGGYDFIHGVFWFVVSMVAIGTNLMPMILTAGLGLFVFESIRKKEPREKK